MALVKIAKPEPAMDWPADQVERRAVADLIPYARNARTHSDAQVAQLAASIKEWGWTIPILIDEDGGIIAGHGRVLAARKLGIEDVPCMVARGWTEAQKRAYTLADNQLALNAGWDLPSLAVELSEIKALGFDELMTGFSSGEIEKITFEPDFQPSSIEEQGKLDEKAKVTCPECGHEFEA